MRIFITGGTGLLGSALINLLRFDEGGHQLTVYARNYAKACRTLHASIAVVDSLNEINLKDFDAVINLAGEPIFDKRWSQEQKATLTASRYRLTELLSQKINNEVSAERPIRFLSASAVGIYGDRGDEQIDETTEIQAVDFGSELTSNWEALAFEARNAKTATLRTGIVLSNQGGALTRLIPPFWSGFGGRISTGSQYMPWIHIKDWARAVHFLLDNPDITGPVNLTAPNPVTNRVFTQTLATTLRRPAFFHLPGFFLKLVLGERSELLLKGQNAVPGVLQKHEFEFRYQTLVQALDELLLL